MASIVKLDYDMEKRLALNKFENGLEDLMEIVGLTWKGDTWDKSKSGHWHVKMTLKEDLEPLEILAVQLIMGSDPVREAYNLRRIRRGQRNWNILFLPRDSEYR